MDVFRIADRLIAYVKERYPDDIALIAYYGSYVSGKQTARSDLDLFFIPATPRGYEAARTFLIDGLSFDFWPMGWDRAERIAAFEEPLASVLADCRLLYARSDADRSRLDRLRQTIAEGLAPERKGDLLEKALRELERCYPPLHRLGRSPACSLSSARREVYSLVTSLLYSLSLANRTYYRRGWGQNMDEVEALRLQPQNLADRIRQLVTERRLDRLESACAGLVEETRLLLLAERKPASPSRPFPDRFAGFYEEWKGLINKALTACERGDAATAFFAVLSADDELRRHLLLAEEGIWPTALHELTAAEPDGDSADLVDRFGQDDLGVIHAAILEWDRRVRHQLQARGVQLRDYSTIEEFASSLSQDH